MALPPAYDPAIRSLPPVLRQAYLQYLEGGDLDKAETVLERSPVRRAERGRRMAQEAENQAMVQRGTGAIQDAERALRRSLRAFGNIRVVRGSPEGRQMRFLVRNLEDALNAVRRAKRGPMVDYGDPDLAIGDRDLEEP